MNGCQWRALHPSTCRYFDVRSSGARSRRVPRSGWGFSGLAFAPSANWPASWIGHQRLLGAASQPGHDQVALNLARPIVIITSRPILNNRALTTARGRPAGAQPGRCGATIGHSDSLKSLASGALSADTLSGCSVKRHRALHRIVANPNHNTSKPHNFISGMLSVPAQNHPG
jgi:hypothetical protein